MQKEKIEALVSLFNARLERFDRTRNIQWKINGLLWAAMVVITSFLYPLSEQLNPIACLVVSLVLISLHGFTLHKIQSSLNWDRDITIYYHVMINEDLNLPIKFRNFFTKDRHRGLAWFVIQIMTTALIATSAMTILFNGH